MLRTKLAKKVLTRQDQKHLTESNVHSMVGFIRTRKMQQKMVEIDKEEGKIPIEPCWECKIIAKKLNLEK